MPLPVVPHKTGTIGPVPGYIGHAQLPSVNCRKFLQHSWPLSITNMDAALELAAIFPALKFIYKKP